MFEAAKSIFGKVPSIKSVDIQMPNIHYFTADLSKLQETNNGDVSTLDAKVIMGEGGGNRWREEVIDGGRGR